MNGEPGAAGPTTARRSLRADARRNRDRPLAAARDVFVEHGAALARYMHRALDLRIAAVMPVLVSRLQMNVDEELPAARARSVDPIDRIIAGARAEASLRPDVANGDVGLLLVRLARPLPGPFPRELDNRLAHRHLDLLLDGLRSAARPAASLAGPAITFDDLASMPQPGGEPDRPPTEL